MIHSGDCQSNRQNSSANVLSGSVGSMKPLVKGIARKSNVGKFFSSLYYESRKSDRKPPEKKERTGDKNSFRTDQFQNSE